MALNSLRNRAELSRLVIYRWVVALCGIGILAYALAGAGDFLAVSGGQPESADLVVVLGGGNRGRLEEGIGLLRRGLAGHILLTGPLDRQADEAPEHLALLHSAGVGDGRITVDYTTANTWQELNHVRALLKSRHWTRVLVVFDPPHMRRVGWVCRKVLGKEGLHYQLVATQPVWWNSAFWWKNAVAARFVLAELGKLLYYQFRYLLY